MNKKKILAIAAVVLIALAASGVIAWLSDDDTAINEIIAGKVEIRLLESDRDPSATQALKPNDTLAKDPHITNTGSNTAYVFLSVDMAALPDGTPIHTSAGLSTAGHDTPLFATQSESGTAYDTANWAVVSRGLSDGRVTQVYAYAQNNKMTPLKKGETTSCVFDSVRMANITDMDALRGLNTDIVITAYAIQATELGANGNLDAPLDVWNLVSAYQTSK